MMRSFVNDMSKVEEFHCGRRHRVFNLTDRAWTHRLNMEPVLVCRPKAAHLPRRVTALSPAGDQAWVDVSGLQDVKELKQKAVEVLPWSRGQHVDNVQLILDGQTLPESTPLSRCAFLPSSTIHLVLRVHGG